MSTQVDDLVAYRDGHHLSTAASRKFVEDFVALLESDVGRPTG